MATESRVWCEPASEPKEYGSGDTPPELRGKVGWRGWPPLLGLGLYSQSGCRSQEAHAWDEVFPPARNWVVPREIRPNAWGGFLC